MRMSTVSIQRLAGLNAVNPDSVSGSVIINGASYPYRRGRLTVKGQPLMISDDHDLIIDTSHKVFGAIVNGVVTPYNKLTPAQLSAIKTKYRI